MAIRARFIVVNIESRDGVSDIQLRATRQTDHANSENPILFTEAESEQNTIHLRLKRGQNATPTGTTFSKGKEVYVDFNPV